jgi:hypothetical protein
MNGVMAVSVDSTPLARAGWSDAVARQAPFIILAYLAVQCVSRTIAPGGLGMDEAEQLVAAQSLELGYGRQPPLYNWLQFAVFQITGEGTLGLALLKHVTLAAVYLGLWTLARRLGANDRTAAVAMLGAVLLPTLLWGAQRDLTHLVLATALAVWTVIAMIDALRAPAAWLFAMIGTLCAAGLLAKWNFAFLLIGLVGAALADPRARQRGWLISVAVAAALLAAPAAWAVLNWELTLSGSGSLGMTSGPTLATWGETITSLASALAAEAALLVLVCLAVFRLRAGTAPQGERDADKAFVTRVLVFSLVSVAAIALAVGITQVRERWLLPLVVLAPVVLAHWLAPRITPIRAGVFYGITGTLLVAMAVYYPLHLRNGHSNPSNQSAPFEAVATALNLSDQVVMVPDVYLGGNLRLVRPDLSVIAPQLPTVGRAGPADLAIWWGRDGIAGAPAPLAALAPTDLSAPEMASFAYPAPHADRRFHVAWTALTP